MKKYYYAGATRVGMRIGAGAGTSGLNYLLSDHLGSTSVATDGNGANPTTQLYNAWGEVRVRGSLPTRYTFTGQYSDSYIKLLWYGSRWYDDSLGRWTQPDSIIPDPSDPIAFDRYAYSRNNPVRYADPSGHDWWDVVGQFATGFVTEFALRNVGWISPDAQRDLGVNASESSASLAGRVAADAASIVLGIDSIVAGAAIATGGSVAACVTTLCIGAAGTVAVGSAQVVYGVTEVGQAAAGVGENLALLSGQSGSGGGTDADPWQVGDPVNKPTTNGYPSWSTAQRRY